MSHEQEIRELKEIRVCGYSDDLVHIENGPQEEEYNSFSGMSFETQNGTIGEIFYNDEGNWEIKIKNSGPDFIQLIKAPGEDSGEEHTGHAVGCSSYSDVAVFVPDTIFSKIII